MLLTEGAVSASPAPAGNLVSDTTDKTFMKDVIEESKTRPVLVDFWAPWCGPCKTLTPVLEKVVKAAKGKVKLVKMNIDEHPQVSQQLGIQSIPTVFAFKNGQPVDGFMGALPENQILAFIERLIGKMQGGEIDLLKSAEDALSRGETSTAAEIYAQVLAEDSENIRALSGLARAHIEAGNLEHAKATLALVPKTRENDASVSAARSAIKLAEQAASVGDLGELESKVAANALDHQARFDLAIALNGKGQRDAAADHLLEIIRRDRKWNEDGARKQLVQFFEAWGAADAATIEGRKKLSSILFS